MFPCSVLSVCLVYLHKAKWFLAVLVTTSGWHSEPGNQAAGKLGGSAPKWFAEDYPKIIHELSPRITPFLSGHVHRWDWEEGECWTEMYVLHLLSGGNLNGAMLVSVSKREREIHTLCVCVCAHILYNDSGSVFTLG